jgi:hypothetical protein
VIINSATFAGAVTGTGKAVYWDSANARFDLALADGSAKQNIVGFADVANANVYAFGSAALFTGLTPGSRYYLDGATAGAITVTAPANPVFIGIAKTATEMFVDVDAQPVTSSQHGQCRLVKSGANLLLSPFNGNKLNINGAVYSIPSAGVSLAPAALAANNPYFIYAYMNAGTMTLEASATGHSTDAATGVEIKTGDATRTLVGQARTITGPAWQDTNTQRFVGSWFNRPTRRLRNVFTASRSTASITAVELNAEIRCEFVCWPDEIISSVFGGSFYNTGGAIATMAAIGYDGSGSFDTVYTGADSTYALMAALGMRTGLSEGYHFITALGWVSSGTGTYVGVGGAVYNTIEGQIG